MMILAGGHADQDSLARFRTEVEAIARQQHPNMVQVFEIGEQNGLPFFSCVALSVDGQHIVSCSADSLQIWLDVLVEKLPYPAIAR